MAEFSSCCPLTPDPSFFVVQGMRGPPFSDNIGPQMLVRLLLALLLALPLALPWSGASTAHAKPKVHTVYAGQRLGSIAKRYNVTVEALCAANGLDRKDSIKPGQKLIVPDADWKPGDALPELDASDAPKKESSSAKSSSAKSSSSAEKPGKPRLHLVQKGHTLSAISGRYGITVAAICTANDLDRRASLEVGQSLVIPDKTDQDGRYARKLRIEGRIDDPAGGSSHSQSWKPYEKPAWRRGYIKIKRYGRAWQGYVIGSKGEVLGHASNKINFVMGTSGDGPEIDARLVRLIAQISDQFGGRELRIVSGYRTQSFVAASKHKEGRAIDFSIPGVPNEALRDYLRTLGDVGVGYYPNSSFVHLDVRGYSAYWVDYAGPGEAPKKSPHAKKRKGQPIESDEPPEGVSDAPSSGEGADGEGPPAPPSGDSDAGSHDAGSHDAGSAGAPAEAAPSEASDPSGEKAKTSAPADVAHAED